MSTSSLDRRHFDPHPQVRHASFFGTSLPAQRRDAVVQARRPQLAVRAAGKQIPVDIEKPIGLSFKESKAAGGGLVVTVSTTIL